MQTKTQPSNNSIEDMRIHVANEGKGEEAPLFLSPSLFRLELPFFCLCSAPGRDGVTNVVKGMERNKKGVDEMELDLKDL
ncbi:unnamed protein product [Linum tenue]|uniref:Uncharacterized protein n=1 Tax=Linum tenue TaxID=586396 RepID=A0AAV0MF77_9ROSI|nr:unnamed protein product [Linum tenue]CAI0445045.1 unnamed protein product [Linum tenue]